MSRIAVGVGRPRWPRWRSGTCVDLRGAARVVLREVGWVVQIWGALPPSPPSRGRPGAPYHPYLSREGFSEVAQSWWRRGGGAAQGCDGDVRGWLLDRGRMPRARGRPVEGGIVTEVGRRASSVRVGGPLGGGAGFPVEVVGGVVGLSGPRSLFEAEERTCWCRRCSRRRRRRRRRLRRSGRLRSRHHRGRWRSDLGGVESRTCCPKGCSALSVLAHRGLPNRHRTRRLSPLAPRFARHTRVLVWTSGLKTPISLDLIGQMKREGRGPRFVCFNDVARGE